MNIRIFFVSLFFLLFSAMSAENVLDGMMERIYSGLSRRIDVEIVSDTVDYFELSQHGERPHIRGNNPVSAAFGLNWYLKYYTGNHLSWNNMHASLLDTLPAVTETLRMETWLPMRYYLNYCTHSYSMAFWDWERWEREIDWMALHGINMPLAVTGSAALWRNVLCRLGYPEDKIDGFVAGPGFQAWWLMNNLEGWGGPVPESFYRRDESLQRRIVERMRQYGMEPVLPGYSGMIPHDAGEKLGLSVSDPGQWLGYTRPAFIQPSDPAFDRVAEVYYDELTRLYGQTRYYSMDPFHEGGNTDGVDLAAAGRTILSAMRRANPEAVWVVQGWQANPRRQMIESLPAGSMAVLDLQAENRPMWCVRDDSFSGHDWIFCMLLNFGGNVGMFGKMDAMVDGFKDALRRSPTLSGVGLTMEGIENNPVMYELLCELPWRGDSIDIDRWLADYVGARYGEADSSALQAWRLLRKSVYGCPADSVQQGTAESVFCARPSDNPLQASTWAATKYYYDPDDLFEAARLMNDAADRLSGNPDFVYDLVDVTRQAVADRGRQVGRRLADAAKKGDRGAYAVAAADFLRLIELQDSLLTTHPDFMLGRWLEMARSCGDTPQEKDWYEWNARVQITTWGNREASDRGGLHDYAHREWQGLLRDFYLPRWKVWFDARLDLWDSGKLPEIDFYAMEELWTRRHNRYTSVAQGDPVSTARAVLRAALSIPSR